MVNKADTKGAAVVRSGAAWDVNEAFAPGAGRDLANGRRKTTDIYDK